jgi:hypothetical protein
MGPGKADVSVSKDRRGTGGFTLLEVQIAVLVLIVALFTLVGHHKVYNDLLDGVTEDKRVSGYMDLTDNRLVTTLTEQGPDAAPPACHVFVSDVTYSGGTPRVDVIVEDSGL